MFKKNKRKKVRKSLKSSNFYSDNFEDFKLPSETRQGIIIIFLFTLGIVSFLSLINLAGVVGVYINNFLKLFFGATRWYVPLLLIALGYFLIKFKEKKDFGPSNYTGIFLFVLAFNSLIHLATNSSNLIAAAKLGLGGGYLGIILSLPFFKIMGFWASLVVLVALVMIGIFLIFNTSFTYLIQNYNKIRNFIFKIRVKLAQQRKEKVISDFKPIAEKEKEEEVDFSQKEIALEVKSPKDVTTKPSQLVKDFSKFKINKIDLPLTLLEGKSTQPNGGDIKANQYIIQKTLENFNIPVEMGEVNVGPTVTQFTLKPAEGIKLSKITTLNNDLALALAAHPIRIEAPIPGRSLVGIEVPNQTSAIVPLKDILLSEEFKKRKSNLTIALGKDVKGQSWLADLSKMPHLLIAGATGSGKSVCINSIIISLLYQNNPADLKLILIDPKRVELLIYNDIPYLLTPVVCDVKKTINALRWTISEMERRLELLSQFHKRNIQSYNQDSSERLTYIVVIIDELADLMAAAGAEVEAAVVRLAQMARAVGIYLIISTQRPSVDVLTGLIKANITSRIAFSVASLVDSRTILDISGAEKLLGRGDMLFISSELSKPKRLQGAIVTDSEIKRVIDYLKNVAKPEYLQEVLERPKIIETDWFSFESNGDPLIPEAKEVIKQAKKASASLLQRRLRIGYARAARILDLLEEEGFIGPADGAKPREILIEREDNDII